MTTLRNDQTFLQYVINIVYSTDKNSSSRVYFLRQDCEKICEKLKLSLSLPPSLNEPHYSSFLENYPSDSSSSAFHHSLKSPCG
jgi:hypothetical protein